MIRTVIFAACLAPMAALAQPYSHSMADCAALYQNFAQWVSTEEKADRLMRVARKWAAAAMAQAAREGRPSSEHAIWSRVDRQTEEWERRGPGFLSSRDFKDWAGYCRAFARDQGIDIKL
jgi:hypothetical protein